MVRVLFLMMVSIGLMSAPAGAQQPGGFPDILGDIFGGQPQQQPFGTPPGITYIENIPVQVTFDSRPDLLPPEATLVLTAIAPPPVNVRRARPLVMGETRILISRLAPPLSLVIAVPSDMAREVDYAQIEAKIIDPNGNIAFRLEDNVEYSGGQPPFLELIPAGALQAGGQTTGQTPNLPSSAPANSGPAPGYIPPQINVIKASVELPTGAQLSRGSVLVMQVTENDLAGGFGPSVIHEQRVDIDQRQPPYSVRLNVPTGSDGTLEQPQLVAYIEDWAARKTFVRSQPVAIPASGIVYTRLDAIVTGQDALPAGADRFVTKIPVTGTAEFDAFKGLPAGAVLTVSLRDPIVYSTIIETTSINLDGLSGYIDFAMDIDDALIANPNAQPILTAEITDSGGNVMFTTPASRQRNPGENIIRLTPTSSY